MKKIIFLILLTTKSIVFCQENKTYIYRNYSDSIIRTPYPQYVVQNNYIYRTYPNSIVRVPYPQYTIKNDYIYRTYPSSIVRRPYPVGSIRNGIPE